MATVVGIVVYGGLALVGLGWCLYFLWMIVNGLYQSLRYTSRGYCPQCHLKMETVANHQSVYGGVSPLRKCPNEHYYEPGGRGQRWTE